MKKVKFLLNNESLSLLMVLVLVVFAVLPLLRKDFFHFSDEVHIANMYQMYKAISSGQIPPRLAPDMSYGFGYPLFNYYYVLPYYLGVIFFKLIGSLTISFKIILLITTIFSSVFMYLFLRKYANKTQSIVGALIYTYTPYRAVDLYVRGALGEVFAFMFFPLIELLVYNISKKSSWKHVGVFAIILGLFFLSHNLSPILILPWFIGYFFLINSSKKGVFRFLIGIILGIGISSYWLIPAIIESSLLGKQPQFNFYDHFPFIKQLFYSKWGYGASLPGINDDISFQIGFPNLLLVALGYWSLQKEEDSKMRAILIFSLVTFFVVLFMMNIRSSGVWNMLGIANYIQFPWRLLLLTTFISSLLVIFVKNKILLGLLFILTIFNIQYFKPSEYFSPDDNYFLKRYFANQQISGDVDQTSEEYPAWLEDYAILPKWVTERADYLPDKRLYSDNLLVVNYTKQNPIKYKAEIYSEKTGILDTNLYYFPGWDGYLNDTLIGSKIIGPYGTMSFVIPPGKWNFELKWEETNFRMIFDIISIISFIICIFIIFTSDKSKKL